MFRIPENRNLLLIIAFGILIRIIFIPFVQITDADATSRIFIAENWLEEPVFLYDGIWLPLHYYFNSAAIFIFGDRIYGPMLFHITITCLTVIPLYHFTKREFSERGALFTIAFYLLCPIIFRNSFQALSELPHAFFIALTLNSISKSIRFDDYKQSIYAGLFMTIASGFRYEAWLLIAVFTLVFLLFKKYKLTFFFWSFSMIFPVFWMIGNYVVHNDFLFGLSGAYNWNIVTEGVNDDVAFGHKVERFIYFFFSWFFLFSPFLVLLLFKVLLQKVKSKKLLKSRFIWSIPFFILFLVFIYKSIEGTLLMQHRFTITLLLLSAPFISLIVEMINWNRLNKIAVSLIIGSLIPMSYVWMKIPYEKMFAFSDTLNFVFAHIRDASQDTFKAIPRISDQTYVDFKNVINKNLKNNDGLILDFTSWDNTFYLALNSKLKSNQIFILDGSKNGKTNIEELKNKIRKHPTGIILLNNDSKFSKDYKMEDNILKIDSLFDLKLKTIDSYKNISILKYKYVID